MGTSVIHISMSPPSLLTHTRTHTHTHLELRIGRMCDLLWFSPTNLHNIQFFNKYLMFPTIHIDLRIGESYSSIAQIHFCRLKQVLSHTVKSCIEMKIMISISIWMGKTVIDLKIYHFIIRRKLFIKWCIQ